MSQEGKITHHFHEKHQQPSNEQPSQQQPPQQQPPQAQYGTFQGVPTSPAIGFPQPAPPHGSRGYQAVPGYAADGIPVGAHHHRLPCCGIGFGWFFFIIGFFLAGIPWYAAAIIFLCCRNVDPREKPAYVCCTIAAVLAIIATVFGATRLND